MSWPPTISFAGNYVNLVPLDLEHTDELSKAAAEGDMHQLWYTHIPKPQDVGAEIARRKDLRDKGTMLSFAVFESTSGRAVGMTSFMNVDAHNKRVEIGSTWYRPSVQRTPLNTECKLLMLRHAFEELDCICVEFRTHFMNTQSRKAIERLGAKLDGILRSNMVMANGTVRDTAVYSIIAGEWPSVKANLQFQLDKPRPKI